MFFKKRKRIDEYVDEVNENIGRDILKEVKIFL